MPKKVEEKLRKQGLRKGLTGKALDRYIYGTMAKRGIWKRGDKK